MTVPADLVTQINGGADDGAAAAGAAAAADTTATARDLASIIAKGAGGSQTFAGATPATGATPASPADPNAPAAASDASAEPAVSPEELTAAEEALQSAGISLGVERSGLPVELQPVYDRMALAVADRVSGVSAAEAQAAEAVQMVQDFKSRLEQEPDRLLLTLAMNRPEIFKTVAEQVARAEQDPNFKDLVLRELGAEARMREADRREKLWTQQQKQVQVRQLVTATAAASRRYGVDKNLAEKVVAAVISGNGGTLDPREVDGIVAELKVTQRPASPRVATVAKLQTPAAPAAPVAGSAGTTLSPGLAKGEIKGGGGSWRQTIKDAFARVGQATQ